MLFSVFLLNCSYKYKDPFVETGIAQPQEKTSYVDSSKTVLVLVGKKILVLSGGFFRGSFQVGALEYLLDVYGAKFDVVVGTSVGALHALVIVQEDVSFLKQIWSKVEKMDDAFNTNVFSTIESVLLRGGLYKSTPLAQIIEKHINLQKLLDNPTRLMVGVIRYETGEFLLMDQYSEDIKRFVLASALIPVFTPPVKIGEFHYFDGGVRSVMPVSPFLKEGVEEIVMISCFNKDDLIVPAEMEKTKKLDNGEFGSIIDFATRTVEIINHQNLAPEINHALEVAPQKGIKITLIQPEIGKCNYGALDYEKDKFNECKAHGFEQAKKAFPVLK
jgi:predicted acylesterase/phospholipase RssA